MLPVPLTQDKMLQLAIRKNSRVAELVDRQGIDFKPTEEHLRTLSIAGGSADLLQALRNARQHLAEITVDTVSGAAIYLDERFQGLANAYGVLVITGADGGEHTHWLKTFGCCK